MGLTRKMLAAMDIPEEKIEEIISAHSETVSALKEERDNYRTDAERLETVEKDLAKANQELEKIKSGDWETKYNALKGEFDTYKTNAETKAVKAAKEKAYTQLLKDAGISEKRIASILRVSDVDGITLDKDGAIKDAETLTQKVKDEWADFIITEKEKGADVPKPAENTGGEVEQPSLAAQLVAKYRNEHYGNPTTKEG